MKEKTNALFQLAIPVGALLLSALLFFLPFFTDRAENKAVAAERGYSDVNGKAFTAVDISALQELGVITEVNHTPNEYLHADTVYDHDSIGEPTSLDALKPAKFGTIRLCFFNLDPMDEHFDEKRQELEKLFNKGSNELQISLRLSFLCSAATVFLSTTYQGAYGSMEDYRLEDHLDVYTRPDPDIVESGKFKPITLRLTFATKRENISPDRLDAAKYVTIHYQTKDAAAGVLEKPLVGLESAVAGAVNSQKNALFSVICVSALLLFAFAVFMILKKNFSLIGQWLALAAVMIFFFGNFVVYGTYFFAALPVVLKALSASLLLFAALLCVRPPQKFRIPHLTCLCAAGCCVLLSVIAGGMGRTGAFSLASTIVSALLSAAVLFFGAADFVAHRQGARLFVPAVGCFAAISAHLQTSQPLYTMPPAAWVSLLIVLGAFLVIGGEFLLTERRNRYLTANLKAEVAAQTASLKAAVEDKDRLLTFLSHDLRKPALALSETLDAFKQRAQDKETLRLAEEMSAKIEGMKDSLFDISNYMRESFTGEDFSAFDFCPYCINLLEHLRPDCSAAGIELCCALPKKLSVYAKQRALTSALENLVLNATEHAHCTKIEISAARKEGFVQVVIADNGKGMDDAANAFSPYVTTAGDQKNMGLGLFIARSQVESMGGRLTFETSLKGTAFTLILLSDR